MRVIQAQILSAALLMLGGCGAKDAGGGAPTATVSPPGSMLGLGGAGSKTNVGVTGGGGTFSNGGAATGATPGLGGVGSMLGAGGRVGAGGSSTTTASAGRAGGGGGVGGAARGAAGSTPMGMPAPKGSMDPVIPAVMGECPNLDGPSTIDFMGIGGLIIDVGAKPASPTAPMLVYWHGTALTNTEYSLMAGEVAAGITGAGGVLVSGETSTGGDGLSGDAIWGMGDIPVMDQLVACAVKDHNVDPRKIYTMGCSAGGLMAVSYATLRSSYVAAAAPNSGGWSLPLTFDSDHTPALMTVHGAAGVDVVAIDFSQTSATADDGFKQHGGFVIDCDTGGAHCGGSGLAGDAWTFFQAHTFGADAWMGTMPPGFGGGVCTPK